MSDQRPNSTWQVVIETEHNCHPMEFSTERKAREVYDGIVKALTEHKEFIDLGDTFVMLYHADMVRIRELRPCEPVELRDYEPTARIDTTERKAR